MLFDVHRSQCHGAARRRAQSGTAKGQHPGREFAVVFTSGRYLKKGPYHLWGGKRIAETWDDQARKLTVTIHGPAGLKETVFFGGEPGIAKVTVAGKPAEFSRAPASQLVHGQITFAATPLTIELVASSDGAEPAAGEGGGRWPRIGRPSSEALVAHPCKMENVGLTCLQSRVRFC